MSQAQMTEVSCWEDLGPLGEIEFLLDGNGSPPELLSATMTHPTTGDSVDWTDYVKAQDGLHTAFLDHLEDMWEALSESARDLYEESAREVA